MIVKEDFLKKLRSSFDLNEYEVKIWTALLSRGISRAGELSEISNVPRSRSYDVLETLEKKGFVMMKLGKPIKYMAVKPEEVVKRVKTGIVRDAEEHAKMLEDIRGTDLYKELQLLHDQVIKKLKNVDVKIVTQENKDNKELIEDLKKYANVKVVSQVNSRFCIVDGKE